MRDDEWRMPPPAAITETESHVADAPIPSTTGAPPTRGARWLLRGLIWLFGVWATGVAALLTILQATAADPASRAIARMALGLVLFWVIGGGALSLLLRRPARRWLQRYARHWQLTFVVGATVMALLEEAVTTAMTNLAPRWGVSIAQAHIAASGNYLDVVLLHSVVVFVPMFIAWAWLLSRHDVAAGAVFVLYGITGCLGETLAFGPQSLAALGFWVYVYGLMIYLPACAIPPQRKARKPGVGATLLALILPILAAIPVAIVVMIIHTVFFANLP